MENGTVNLVICSARARFKVDWMDKLKKTLAILG